MTRSDVRTRARDYLYESTADIWSDAMLNRFYEDETRSFPSKDIYLEEVWTTDTVVDQYDYALPTGTEKVEKVERNDGTSSKPDWVQLNGWDNYSGALYLNFRPTISETIRIHIKKTFTVVDNDATSIDIPDSKIEVLVWGMVIRGYQALIGYLRGNKSWDSVTKPGDLSIPVVQNWLRDAKQHQKELVQQYLTIPRPRDIDLTS